ncbi:MAG: hypothetical protein IT223_02920 [Crocinitomicaceae bacterium]|nr:hypothetical protein [Crocinitomicaceae bacterium]
MKKTQDKGHREQFSRWLQSVRNGGQPLIEFDDLYNTSKAAILAVESLTEGRWIEL